MNPALLALLGARAAVGGGTISATYLGNSVASVSGLTLTVSAATFGAASAGRTIVAAVATRGGSGSIASATIGGITATIDLGPTWTDSYDPNVAFLRASVPTGTGGNIVVTFTGPPDTTTIGWFSIDGPVSLTAATTTATNSLAVTVPDGGVAIIGAEFGVVGTWTGFTPSYTTAQVSTWRGIGGILAASGTVSNSSTTFPRIAAAAYQSA